MCQNLYLTFMEYLIQTLVLIQRFSDLRKQIPISLWTFFTYSCGQTRPLQDKAVLVREFGLYSLEHFHVYPFSVLRALGGSYLQTSTFFTKLVFVKIKYRKQKSRGSCGVFVKCFLLTKDWS